MAENKQRYHSLDALRASALLLGIFFHAAESFCPDRFSWAVVDPQAHWAFEYFQHALHSFRMETFYLIAGFFAHLVVQQRGLRAFISNRLSRIAVPFVVGWIILYPAMILIWIWGRLQMGRLDLLGLPAGSQGISPVTAWVGFFLSGEFLGDNFNLVHLWFLYYLLLLYTAFLTLRFLVARLPRSLHLLRGADQIVARVMTAPWRAGILAVPTAFLVHLMGGWVRTPNNSLVPDPRVLLTYALFFGLGWMIHRQTELLDTFRSRWALNLGVGIVLSLATFFGRQLGALLDPAGEHQALLSLVHMLVYALTMWVLTFGFCGLVMHYFSSESPCWRYIADSSYWLYLSHLVIVVPLQILVSQMPWAVPLKYIAINLVAFPILFASYELLVRGTFIGKQLNGRKFPHFRLRNTIDLGTKTGTESPGWRA